MIDRLQRALLVLFLCCGPALAHAQSSAVSPEPATTADGTPVVETDAARAPEGSEEVDESLLQELDPDGATVEDRGTSSDGHWRGGDVVDEAFRDALRARDEDGQEIAALLSDVLLASIALHAGVIDAVVTPLVRGEGERAWAAQYSFDLALGITLTAGEAIKLLVGRARPFERDCVANPDRRGCDDDDRFSSFLSLHSGVAFTSAGYTCAMHLERRLFDDLGADIASCAASLGVAAIIGTLRIVADRHYFSDVISGATLGLLVGFLIPALLVGPRPDPSEAAASPLSPSAPSAPTYALSFGGAF